MEKMRKVTCCDLCEKERKYLSTCAVCSKDHCDECAQDDDWRFVDTCLCVNCNHKVWKEFQKLIKKLKGENDAK